jgi:hypothetical protein
MRQFVLGAVAATSVAGAAAGQVVDGNLDGSYGAPLVVQDTYSSFGGGNSLAAAYAQIGGGNLNLFFSGKLGTGFEKLVVFFDTVAGGQNTITGTPGQGVLGGIAGLTFDMGFSPDYMFQINGDGTTHYVDWADLNNPGGGVYLGSGGYNLVGGALSGGAGLGVSATINNSGSGLPFGFGVMNPADVAAAAAYGTGIEIRIPLGLLSNPTGAFTASAFILGGDGTTRSTQFLGGIGGGFSDGDYSSVAGLNLNHIPGNQYFVIPAPGSLALLGLGALAAGRRRR